MFKLLRITIAIGIVSSLALSKNGEPTRNSERGAMTISQSTLIPATTEAARRIDATVRSLPSSLQRPIAEALIETATGAARTATQKHVPGRARQ